MMRRSKAAALAAALAIAPAGLATGTALAAPAKFPTGLTIGYSKKSGGSFAGKASSKNRACLANRPVTVYLKRSGGDKAVGTDKTSSSGAWQIHSSKPTPGYYYASTPTMTLGGGQGVCDSAKSATTRAS